MPRVHLGLSSLVRDESFGYLNGRLSLALIIADRDPTPVCWASAAADTLKANIRLSLDRDPTPVFWASAKADTLIAYIRLSLDRDPTPVFWASATADTLIAYIRLCFAFATRKVSETLRFFPSLFRDEPFGYLNGRFSLAP